MANDIHEPDPIVSTPQHEVNYLDPQPETIDLTEIAAALSRENRYHNLSNAPVTVLTHLNICDFLADEMGITEPDVRLLVLLHDAHEAYMGDMNRPLKRLLDRASHGLITEMETDFDVAIFERFGLDTALARHNHPHRAVVKKIDNLALAHEVHAAFPAVLPRWGSLPEIDTSSETHKIIQHMIYTATSVEHIQNFFARVTYLSDRLSGVTHAGQAGSA